MEITQKFFVIFSPLDTRLPWILPRLWTRFLYLFMPERKHRDDFAHCKLVLLSDDVQILFTPTPWRWLIGMNKCTKGEALNTILDSGVNAVLYVEVRQSIYASVARSSKMCHTIIANILGINKRIYTPFGLYRWLLKNGAIPVWRYEWRR